MQEGVAKRARLLADLSARLTRYEAEQAPDAVMSDEALAQVTELMRVVPDLNADPQVLQAAGWLYWFRYLAQTADEDRQSELTTAQTLLDPVYRLYPEGVPDSLRAYFRERAMAARTATLINAERLLDRVVSFGDLRALDEAIRLMHNLVTDPSTDHPELAAMVNLAVALAMRFDATGSSADLDEAIDVFEQALATVPTGDSRALLILTNLAIAQSNRFERRKALTDLDRLVEVRRQIVDATPGDQPHNIENLSNLGLALLTRFEYHGVLAELNEAVAVEELAVASTPANHPYRIGALANLALVLAKRFEFTNAVTDLARVVEVRRDVVFAVPADHPDRPQLQCALGLSLLDQYRHTGRPAELDEAITVQRQAATDTLVDFPDRARYEANLSFVLYMRYLQNENPDDLDEAVIAARHAVTAIPLDSPVRAFPLDALGRYLFARFIARREFADLNEAIDVKRRAINATTLRNPEQLSGLGLALSNRADRTGNLGDLDEAVDVLREAVSATIAEDSDRAARLSMLADALRARYERNGVLMDLNESVEISEQALTCTSPSSTIALTTLSVALTNRFERTGNVPDLDRAVDIAERVIAESASDDLGRAADLSALGLALQARFHHFGALADLDRAVDLAQQAVDAVVSAELLNRATYLNGLAVALGRRFERTQDVSDLDRAAEVGQQIVDVLQEQPDRRGIALSNLAIVLSLRYRRLDDPLDLDKAVRTAEEAVDTTATDDPRLTRYLSNLGMLLNTRFLRVGDLVDLNRAVEIGQRAVAGKAADHPDRAIDLVNLAMSYQTRYNRADARKDALQAIDLSRQAALTPTARPVLRLRSARRWGDTAAAMSDWAEAVEGYAAAVELLGLVAQRSLSRRDQEHWLKDATGLATQAAASCLQLGDVDRAVELWEHGRGVLFAQTLETRSDLTQLAENHRDLALRFIRLRDEFGNWFTDADETNLSQLDGVRGLGIRASFERQRELATQFDQIISEIRGRRGFERFLAPPSVSDLLIAAEEGPVVLLNVSSIRSDAMILANRAVQVVRLPQLTPATVQHHVSAFLTMLETAQDPNNDQLVRVGAEAEISKQLGWLWDAVTEPVLKHLGFTAQNSSMKPLPRVWWCAAGPLALLPLHASGYHSTRFDRAPRTVLDLVVSSYVPTIRGLTDARRDTDLGDQTPLNGMKEMPGMAYQAVVVAMPRTPEADDLPGAASEATLLQSLLPERVLILNGSQATYESVTAALPRCRWAHFACHCSSDLDNPSASQLLLQDHGTRPLTVLDISRIQLGGVRMAFLSACSTARTGARLADEPIHLAAAFHLAGYRHVIATLWPISDWVATRIAADVYKTLIAGRSDSGEALGDESAAALHKATRRLRAVIPGRPSDWAAHLHDGA